MSAVASRLYRLAWVAGLLGLSPVIAAAAIADRWSVRRRLWPRRSSASGDWWWWHGASVGEVRGLAALYSAIGWDRERWFTVVSSTTGAGVETWQRLGIGDESPHILPVDLHRCWDRIMPERRPRLVVLSETELWPVWLSRLAEQGVPVALASARLSRRAAARLARWRLLDGAIGSLHVAAQTDADATAFLRLGVPEHRVAVAGSLKWPRAAPVDRATARRRLCLSPDELVLVGGSIRRSELAPFVAVLKDLKAGGRQFRTVLAPRRIEDCAHAGRLLARVGMSSERWTALRQSRRGWRAEVLLVDSFGDLAWLYGAATAAVIGGSWERAGGHNPFEAAAYGVPIAYGPNMDQPGCDVLERSGRAARLTGWGALTATLAQWLGNPPVFAPLRLSDPVRATLEAWQRWGIAPDGMVYPSS